VSDSSKIERAYTVIREAIVKGEYSPGQRLVVRSLSDGLGMSTVPIREALRRLEAEGWVTFQRNVGAQVRPLDATEYVAVMDTLAWVEGHATALAAPHLTADDIDRARTHNRAMRAAIERYDPIAASQYNQAFHAVLRERCPNAYLNAVVQTAAERIAAMIRTVFIFVPMRTLTAVDEHEHLLGLIESHAEAETIEHYARDHKLRTVAAYLARETAVDEPPSTVPPELVADADLADTTAAAPH
jgi:DNA-binding GntR family transcriptional regulator